MKKYILSLIPILTIVSLSSCNNKKEETHIPSIDNYAITHDSDFGGAYIKISYEDFNNLGFAFGDSIDITFVTKKENMTSTVTYEDIGYYSGYYVPAGQELLVGYKGYDFIKFCINYGEDIYAEHNLSESSLATIKLNKAGKYKNIEETLSLTYEDDRSKYESDEQFANFREITTSNIKPKTLYRGASPIDNSRSRAEIVDSLLLSNNIQYNIDLADKETDLDKSKYTIHDYFQGLKDDNKVIFLGMAAAYKAEDFSNKMKTMFLSILNNEGPHYIHCLEGKDRTGYVCMVLEALCGASYQELVDDYFVTYENYYGIEKNSERYNVIKELHIDEMIRYVFSFNDTVNLLGAHYANEANNYLLAIGLTQVEIDAIQDKLTI